MKDLHNTPGTMAVVNKPVIIETIAAIEKEELPAIQKSQGELPKTITKNIPDDIATATPLATAAKPIYTQQKTVATQTVINPDDKKESQLV